MLLPFPPAGADADDLRTPEVKLRCHQPLLYRDDELVVEFESPHDNFDFGIRRAAVHGQDPDELFLLSFKPGKNDHIAPLIPPRKFASMRQITLNPKTTCGSLSNW